MSCIETPRLNISLWLVEEVVGEISLIDALLAAAVLAAFVAVLCSFLRGSTKSLWGMVEGVGMQIRKLAVLVQAAAIHCFTPSHQPVVAVVAATPVQVDPQQALDTQASLVAQEVALFTVQQVHLAIRHQHHQPKDSKAVTVVQWLWEIWPAAVVAVRVEPEATEPLAPLRVLGELAFSLQLLDPPLSTEVEEVALQMQQLLAEMPLELVEMEAGEPVVV